MNKNARSKIPVLVTKQKLPIQQICSDKKILQTENNLLKKQTLDTNKTTKMQIIQKKAERKVYSELEKSKKLKENMNCPDSKNKQTSLKTNAKYNSSKVNNKVVENKIKFISNKRIICEGNTKTNLQNKGTAKTFNVKKNDDSKRTLPFSETRTKYYNDLVEDKEENFPSPKSSHFEMEKCTLNEEKVVTKDCFSANENVEFEANEFYRNMILSNKELSPSICKLLPNVKLSSLRTERPSVLFQGLEISDDPLKEVVEAFKKSTLLSVKRIKKENKLPRSPYKDRNSMYYTPYRDLNAEYRKGLEDLKQKKSQKTASRSNKKVTFNLNIQECSPINIAYDIQHDSLKNSEHKLMQINKKSEENTPNLLQSKKEDEIKAYIASKCEPISNQTINIDNAANVMKVSDKNIIHESKNAKELPQSVIILKNNQRILTNISPDYKLFPLSGKKKEVTTNKELQNSCWNSSPDFIYDNKKNKYNAATNVQKDHNVLPSERKTFKNTKIYTPKPISFSVKSEINENYSPEFLVNKKSRGITDLAPICTPLVLRTQAKNIIFSPEPDEGPIPLKLDFTEAGKDTPKRETCKNHSSVPDSIVTMKRALDYLADQECHLSLLNENFPAIHGRYLTNPVAETLSEGDDMHFIPIRF